MMKWVTPMMWGFYRLVAYVLQLVGLTGLLIAALVGVYMLADWMLEV